jgi:hypothetical protein
VIEDQARQHLRYATSDDGLRWSEPQVLAGPPRSGYGYIARGFWNRDGELLALASLYEAPAFHDGDLELVAFRWNSETGEWQPAGRVYDNALNNFEPEKLPTGEWIMSRRASDRSVSILIGGVRGIDQWEVIPFADYRLPDGTALEEPHLWLLPSGTVVGMFRDNSLSGRLARSYSTDSGRTWSAPVRTNFPDATSKFHGLRTSGGQYVLVSNPQPRRRNPLCLSVSDDGVVFRRMYRLPVPEQLEPPVERSRDRDYDTLQYPHVIEQDGALHVAFSRNKRTVELVRVRLSEITGLGGR